MGDAATFRTRVWELPVRRVTFNTRSVPTAILMRLHACVTKPGAETVIPKLPGGKAGTLYKPSVPVVTARAAPVASSLMETVAPGTGAPDSDVMVPVSDPPGTCAAARLGTKAHNPKSASTAKRTTISFELGSGGVRDIAVVRLAVTRCLPYTAFCVLASADVANKSTISTAILSGQTGIAAATTRSAESG